MLNTAKKITAASTGADNNTNIISLPLADSPGNTGTEPLLAIRIIMVEGVKYISDGKYSCPAKKGRYTLRPFLNPSGELVVRLDGYRPEDEAPDETVDGEESQTSANSENGEDTSATGKKTENPRYRKNYETIKEADEVRSALLREDQNSEKTLRQVWTSLTQEEIDDAEKARRGMRTLPPREWSNGKWSFEQLVEYVAAHFKPCRNPKDLKASVTEFLASQTAANLKFATTDGKGSLLKKMVRQCPPKTEVHEVPRPLLKQLIFSGEVRRSWKKNKSILNTFFTWAAHEDRGYCPENPVTTITIEKRKADDFVPCILPNDIVVDLLAKAQAFKGGRLFLYCVCAIVVALRPAELARIQAIRKVLGVQSFRFGEEADERFVQVIGKIRALRQAEIPAEFVPIIQAYVEAGYPVIPRNFAHDWTLLRAQVGYLGRKDLLPAHLFSDDLQEWTNDILRHIGITHYLNRSKDEQKTALWAGNSPQMIFKHYKGKATMKETREFYAIAGQLRLPTVQELKEAGVPEGASNCELRRLKCPVDVPNTFFLNAKQFGKARKAYLAKHPEAAKPETKGPRRGNVAWTKRRMLQLPKNQEDLIRLVWTRKVDDLACEHKVARSTMGLALQETGLPSHLFPPKGYWQMRAAGEIIPLPPEVQKVFPKGLPACKSPVGRQVQLERPSLAHFFHLLWKMKAREIAVELGWSQSTVEREIRRLRLPRPGNAFWLAKPEHRQIPDEIKRLLALTSVELEQKIARGVFAGGVFDGSKTEPGDTQKQSSSDSKAPEEGSEKDSA